MLTAKANQARTPFVSADIETAREIRRAALQPSRNGQGVGLSTALTVILARPGGNGSSGRL